MSTRWVTGCLLFCLLAPLVSLADDEKSANTIAIRALIDGSDVVKVRGNTLWYGEIERQIAYSANTHENIQTSFAPALYGTHGASRRNSSS